MCVDNLHLHIYKCMFAHIYLVFFFSFSFQSQDYIPYPYPLVRQCHATNFGQWFGAEMACVSSWPKLSIASARLFSLVVIMEACVEMLSHKMEVNSLGNNPEKPAADFV